MTDTAPAVKDTVEETVERIDTPVYGLEEVHHVS